MSALFDVVGVLFALGLAAGGGLIAFNGLVVVGVDSAIHQIYQLNAIVGGLILIGIAGIWLSTMRKF